MEMFQRYTGSEELHQKIETSTVPKKKSKILEKEEIFAFLEGFKQILIRKAITIIGHYGGLRRAELTNLQFKDFVVQEEHITVFIPNSKTDHNGSKKFHFIVPKTNYSAHFCAYSILKLYIDAVADKTGLFSGFTMQNPMDSLLSQRVATLYLLFRNI